MIPASFAVGKGSAFTSLFERVPLSPGSSRLREDRPGVVEHPDSDKAVTMTSREKQDKMPVVCFIFFTSSDLLSVPCPLLRRRTAIFRELRPIGPDKILHGSNRTGIFIGGSRPAGFGGAGPRGAAGE